MTYREIATALRQLADCMEKVVMQCGRDVETGKPKPMLEGDAAVGAAVFLCYLRDCVTVGGRDQWDRGSLLVLLETMSRDQEMFPCGVAALMWQADDEGDSAAFQDFCS